MDWLFLPTLFDHVEGSPIGVLRISSDGDDGRIFLGLKFSILGLFWVRKFGKYFLGSLI